MNLTNGRSPSRAAIGGITIACNGAGGRVGFENNASRAGPLMRTVRRKKMGTTFVSLNDTASASEIGFWMRDSILELWLRLLALHISEPTDQNSVAYKIRNQWLLASRGYFGGHVPHDLHNAISTLDGRETVNRAIDSLMSSLAAAPPELNGATLNLLGMEGHFQNTIPTQRLIDVGNAFRDLLAGNITCTVESTEFMPGST